MSSHTTTLRDQYEEDGFLIHDEPLIDKDLTGRASEGMALLRRAEYDTGSTPPRSFWKPGDDPDTRCKIKQPPFVNKAIWKLASHTNIGRVAADITERRWHKSGGYRC